MDRVQKKRIGYTCAYTPLPLIEAAGFSPYRVLPLSESPDQSGQLLHDNLCPHIKRVLDRALSNDFFDLEGMLFINSCDSMRRLADAWKEARPNDKVLLVDIPTTKDSLSYSFFSEELSQAWKTLVKWSEKSIDSIKIIENVKLYNKICELFSGIKESIQKNEISGGYSRLQTLYNQASTNDFETTISILNNVKKETDNGKQKSNTNATRLFLFGNMLPDPEAYSMIESCGAVIADDDFCSGSRLFSQINISSQATLFKDLAYSLINRPLCARTIDPCKPGKLSYDILEKAKKAEIDGVIAHIIKFCDPYLDRIAMIRSILKNANLPLLVIEGDCTLRSLGQQKTRIEAFIEMLR